MTELTSEQSIFLNAIGLPVSTHRAAYLDQACRGNRDLRAALDELLAAHDRLGGAIPPAGVDREGASPVEPTMPAGANTRTAVGAVLAGRYKLLEGIGEGGMGSVWMAQQLEPVKRLVAIKLIKAGMDSKAVLARFEQERQALALMDHPHIAKVLDAGATPDGRPFFVMELVKGVPFTKYCDECRLTPRERLKLFVPVCQAIQHAHQKGVIHRDIKPSNILVALYDDRPVPKVIDFGIAKAIEQKLTERTLHTGIGAVVGTPEYMSPEQAGFNNLDVDTRSDVYSLGTLLYELLTGGPPFSRKELEEAGLVGMLRVIREREPPRPSTKLSTAEGLPRLAASRGTEPGKLARLVRGELDWIVMKALEKDRNRRYESANGLAADVGRYLSGEPVQAVPPSAAYRLRKFLRRNRGPVVAAAAVLAALVLGIAGTTAGLVWALREQGQARQSADQASQEAEKARQAAEVAQRRLGQVGKGNAILESIFQDISPRQEKNQDKELRVVLGERLNQAAAQLDAAALDDPVMLARLQYTLGCSLLHLGDPDKAIPLFRKSHAARKTLLGQDHPDTLNALGNLAWAYQDAGRPKEALALYQEAFKLWKKAHGPTHCDTRKAMNNLAMAYVENGRPADGLLLIEQTLKLTKEALGPSHRDTLVARSNLASTYLDMGRAKEAVPLFEEVWRVTKETLAPTHPDTLSAMNELAVAYGAVGRAKEALPLAREALRLAKKTLGPRSPGTLTYTNTLAEALAALGRRDQALVLHEEALKLRKDICGPTHRRTLVAMSNLGLLYLEVGRMKEGLAHCQDAFNLGKLTLDPKHPNLPVLMNNLAGAYKDAYRLHEALPLYEEALKLQKEVRGTNHPDTITMVSAVIAAYFAARQPEKALRLLPDYLKAMRGKLGSDSLVLAHLLVQISEDLLRCEQYAEAERLLREALVIRAKKEPTAWTTFHTRSLVGASLLGQERYTEAEPLLLKGYQGLKQREVRISRQVRQARLTEALRRLVELYDAWNKKDEAATWRKELEAIRQPPDKSKGKSS